MSTMNFLDGQHNIYTGCKNIYMLEKKQKNKLASSGH